MNKLNFLFNRSLEMKILLPMVIMEFILVGVFSYLLISLTIYQNSFSGRVAELELINTQSSKLTQLQDQIQNNLTNYAFDKNFSHVEFILRDQKEIDRIVEELQTSMTNRKALAYLQKFEDSRGGAAEVRDNIYKSISEGNTEQIGVDFDKWMMMYDDIEASLRDFYNYASQSYVHSSKTYEDILNNMYGLVIVLVIGIVTLSVWLFFYLRRNVTEPVRALSRTASGIAHGNFAVAEEIESDDEIGQLSRDLQFMSAKLKLYYEELETEVREKEQEIEKTRELNARKDEFIGVASHELKTPLTSIKAYVQIVERLLEKYEDKRVRTYLEKTNDYIDKLEGLISDLLDVSKIQAGKLQFNLSKFSFDDLVKESIDSVQPLSPSHKIELVSQVNKQIVGDRDRLGQVFVNLLSNAVKYSPNCEKVEVRTHNGKGDIVVAVKDYGVGIPAKDQKRIFERFYRVGSVEQKFSGLGIGLYISGEIVKRHGGKIWVESEEGKGSTFYFSLPINKL